jgi:hypothetical protein
MSPPSSESASPAVAAAIGLWQFQREESVDDDGGRPARNTRLFKFDGDTVTLRLLSPHRQWWSSPDNFYRLAARFDDDTLSYRPPFGDWTQLATFEDDGFVEIGGGRKRIFAKIEGTALAERDRPILAPREAHDYRRRVDGTLSG